MTEHDGKAALAAIIAGLDGVTEGPWYDRWDGEGGAFVTGSGFVRADMVGPLLDRKANAGHIARCDPLKMRAIAAYVAELEAQMAMVANAAAELEAALREASKETGDGK